MSTYKPDSAATAAAQTLARCRAVHSSAVADLQAAQAELDRLTAAAPVAHDADAAVAALADAQARDAVHQTDKADDLARQQAADAEASATAQAVHTQRLAAARETVTGRTIALEGVERVLADAIASSKAATAAAARGALEAARSRYRDAAVNVLGLVSDILALETLVQLADWPDSRALSTRSAGVELPALGSFSQASATDLHDIGARFVPLPADTVALVPDASRTQAIADLHDIRAQLEGAAA